MSICRCKIHDENWDSDANEICPKCEDRWGKLEEKEIEFSCFIQNAQDNLPLEEWKNVYTFLNHKLEEIRQEKVGLRNDMFS